MTFFQQWPLVIMPTLADLPPRQVDRHDGRGGQKAIFNSMRAALLAPLLGLPGLAVPVGRHGKLRTGVQIMAMRNREDLCLDAGEVIEAAEGVVTPIDPALARLAARRQIDPGVAQLRSSTGMPAAVFPSLHLAMATLPSMVGEPGVWPTDMLATYVSYFCASAWQ